MFCRILVPLDGWPIAERGLSLAAALAQRSGGMLILVRVVPRDASPAYVTSGDDYLHSRVAELQATNLRVITQVLRGEPAVAIAAATREHVADLVVMVTHSRTEPDHWLHRSVAESVIRESTAPVLLVRARSVNVVEQGQTHPTILVPLDGSTWSEAALPVAKTFACQLNGELLLVEAVRLPALMVDLAAMAPMDISVELDTLSDQATAYLDDLARQLRSEGYRVRTLVDIGRSVDSIMNAERRASPALVVMATHAREGFSRLLFGSVTSSVLHDGDVPVVAVPPRATRVQSMQQGGGVDHARAS